VVIFPFIYLIGINAILTHLFYSAINASTPWQVLTDFSSVFEELTVKVRATVAIILTVVGA